MGVESTADEIVKMPPNGHKAELKSQREKKLLVPSSINTGNLAIPWKIENSEDLYRIEGWGRPYFSINAAGHVTVSPKGERGGSLDLFELVNALQQRNLGLPMLIRFSDILEDRIERLNACFAKAIARYNYPGVYRGVFPVKCNQQRHLVEDLVRFGKPHQFGLEAGSKPELMIALALLDTPGALLICNGYKDQEYIETAMLAQRLGQTPIIVLEQIEEVDLAIAASRQLGIKPILGVRAKLSTQGMGRWGTSTGDRAKFGLTIPEIMEAVEKLGAADLLGSLQLLHFHIGSQISAINVIKDAIQEASRIYVELAMLGADMKYLDVGGGLGVDYDGSQTNFYTSKNYNMQNYANDIVAELKDTCDERQITVPTLVSESGRAISSHQSVLIFDVLSTSDVPLNPPDPPQDGESPIIKYLWETYQSINKENYQEFYHDAAQFKEEAISRFNLGILRLNERAKAERLYWACCQKVLTIIRQEEYVPDELEDLEKIMASIYYINLSVFQSAPDCWAIDQLFPIMPIHRLDEEPTRRGILADLTCDSDGKIDRFIDLRDVKSVLELHKFHPGKPYYLGMFLNGAYQEIMGNLHNLFGDTNAVHINLTPKGYQIEHVVKGDTMSEVVSYVQYDAEDMVENIRQRCERALEEQHITLAESQRLLQTYEQSLQRYTYLNS
ncbi:MAG: biosynthetic arginine decarboxylase [Dolichospermum sp.]|jgi:arginine decarboxylase|uniref:biosynthetic arginine decarboxylase n=1 Tax=Dolichospermum circinale TaxID=109265 RepID=UPI002330C437|nr:biosynthetic arginine decarboxylase [Dolichospermum circinale]MCE2720521.1 biosynthetic arginine decarboxylase [Anabaena sp. 49628_E55]MDB9489235.1 biosynthetic arginine decarboxylase [Dolichospermum circinale CS-534/05]